MCFSEEAISLKMESPILMAHEPGFYSYSATALNGECISMDRYRDRVLLIVNTASRCGFTPQYAGLAALYEKFKDRGLVILGFPCNQFGAQEPGSETEIAQFCQLNYGVGFPMFSKIDVNGPHAHPIYQFLKSERKGMLGALGLDAIKWNFTKFLVDRQGSVIARFGPSTPPTALEPEILKLL